MSKKYRIWDGREYMPVNESGHIGRTDSRTGAVTVKPSPAWFVRGAIRYNNFGAAVEFIAFPECAKITEWMHKNGKPKWHICDHDHGTNRVWGGGARLQVTQS